MSEGTNGGFDGEDRDPTFATQFCNRPDVVIMSGVILIVIGALVASVNWKSSWMALGWRRSEQIVGFVIEVSAPFVDGERQYQRVTYRYEYQGEFYTGEFARRVDATAGAGAPVRLLVSPTEPSRSIRADSSLAGPMLRLAIAGFVALLGLGNLVLGVRRLL